MTPLFRTPLRTFALLVGLLTLSAAPSEASIVVNGDFETGAVLPPAVPYANAPLTNWDPTNSPSTGPTVTQVIGQDPASYGFTAHSGSISVNFTSDSSASAGALGSISQTLTTTASQTYILTLWVANPTTDINARANLFQVIWDGVSLNLASYNPNFAVPNPGNPQELSGIANTYVVAGDTSWFEVDIPVTASGTSTTLTIAAQNNNNATFVDDVSVTETPEPSSLFLLFAGAAVPGSRRRRQQRAA